MSQDKYRNTCGTYYVHKVARLGKKLRSLGNCVICRPVPIIQIRLYNVHRQYYVVQCPGNTIQRLTMTCHLIRPPALGNLSQDVWLNLSAPLDKAGNFDRCSMFDVDFSLNGRNGILERPPEDAPTIACEEFEYDTSEFQVFFSSA